jgi:hypothetical protein
MRKLYLQYFSHKDASRKKELDFCTKHNINNKNFDKVYVLLEKEEDDFGWLHNERTEVININKRANYKTFVDFANERSEKGDIHILTNLDIFFDDSVKLLDQMKDKDFITLTRWDINAKTKQAKFFNVNCSQDTWIWKNEIDFDNTNLDLTYNLGTPGCDNAICGEFHENGYRVLNPSLSVKTFHLHEDKSRSYTDDDVVRKKLYLLYPTQDFENSKIQYWKDCTNFKPSK